MINLEFGGRLGNQMFQYAAVRTLADRRGERHRCSYNGRFQPETSRLHRCFQLDGDDEFCDSDKSEWAAARAAGQVFSPRRESHPGGILRECYDPGFFYIPQDSFVRGGFQSERYFHDNRAAVLRWYTPLEPFRRELARMAVTLPGSPERRCCVAIRRSDYATLDKGLAYRDQGWMLPRAYYRYVLAGLPKDLSYVFVSDNPDFVREVFADIQDKYISEHQHPVVELLLMTLCRYNVIANSSFSWWGAWCNRLPDQVVIAPKYHLGWARRLWYPEGMRHTPPGWQHVDVLEAITS
jgi:hypothetical protein